MGIDTFMFAGVRTQALATGGQTDRRQIDRRQVYILKFCAGERGGGSGRGCIVLILLACRRARSAGPGQHVGLAVLECWELEAGILRMRVFL